MRQDTTTIRKISDKKTLEEIIRSLKTEEEFIIDMDILEFFEVIKSYKINYSRIGFKKYVFSPINEKVKTTKSIIIFRFICFICLMILFILLVYEVLSSFWIELESYFISLPLASGVLSGVILIVMSILGKLLFKKSLLAVLKSYLGVDNNVNARRRD